LLPFEDQFDQIPDHEKDEEEDENDVDIDQTEDDDIVCNWNPRSHLRDVHLNGGEYDDQDRDNPDDQKLIASPSGFR
jgi:hypothetical protein